MKSKKFKVLFAFIGLFLMTISFVPQKSAKAGCDKDLENWFCYDSKYCLTNTDVSNCNGSS